MEQYFSVAVQYDVDNSAGGSSVASTIKDVNNCGECNKVLSSAASLKRHMLLTHDPFYVRPEKVLKYSCKTCGKAFATPSYLKRHMTVHTGEKKFKCQHCNKRFTQNEHFQRHLLAAHTPGAKIYRCTFHDCQCGFVGASLLRRHMKQHVKWGTWKCEHCDKIFLYQSFLKRHLLVHVDPSLICKCDICEALFSSAAMLSRHKKIHTRENVNTCQVCHLTFQSPGGFRDHVIKKCGRDAYKYKCDQCHRCFFKESRLLTHKRTHEPGARVRRQKKNNYTCRVCSKMFHGSREFRKHTVKKCGRKAYPYTCDKCPRNFFRESMLKTHMVMHEEGAKVFQCGTCENTYSIRKSLRTHILSSGHEAEYVKFKCKVCGEKFPNPALLETHSAIHEAEESTPPPPVDLDPRFTCKKCLRMFPDKAELLSHISADHTFAFVCQICGERFKSKDAVKTHRKVEHKDK
ncbi:zinc finger protein 431-like [Lineus longissimus]|uniref:zinc finger protein 431-like n=1 Tax=Lineus longissimus TaxID=88925 RepID=UPI002B4E0277